MAEPFRFSNGRLAYNGDDLLNFCKQFPQDSINYLVRGDFEKWLDYLGEKKLAQKAKSARQANLSNQERLQKFLYSEQESQSQTKIKAETSTEKKANSLTKFFQSFQKLLQRG